MANIKEIRITPLWDDLIEPSVNEIVIDISTAASNYSLATSLAIKKYVDYSTPSIWEVGVGTESIISINSTHPNTAPADAAFATGALTIASGQASHSEGFQTEAGGIGSHAEGVITLASGDKSHAEGEDTLARGTASHAEGFNTEASGIGSHAEGLNTLASGDKSHAEGEDTLASGQASHSEGFQTEAGGIGSHAEGVNTLASGFYSHAGGEGNKILKLLAVGDGSFNHSYQASTTAQYGAYGYYSAILGGVDNKTSFDAMDSLVLGGSTNEVIGTDSAIIGGSNQTLSDNNTVMVPKLETSTIGEGIIMASPDGTRYKVTVANGGTLEVNAV
jgi:hypothetical protein